MPTTIAFDIYGTLIDTHGLVSRLRDWVGDEAPAFSQLWRDKQLEYSFRRGLMGRYADFATCTREALAYTCQRFDLAPPEAEQRALLQAYGHLPAYADVAPGLKQLKQAGLGLFAFSNGTAQAVTGLLEHAGIRDLFAGVVSVDEVASFKPHPAVYEHFLKRAQCEAEASWLVSSNPFDILGAGAVGMRTLWLRRQPNQPFDPWSEWAPTAVRDSLRGLETLLG